MKYVFPAIFEPNELGGFSVFFPDIEGCVTDGATEAEALENAEDALNLMLVDMIDVPSPTKATELTPPKGGFVSMILADTVEYAKKYNKKAVRKNISIPQWLDTLALKKNINFSDVLQKGLLKELAIE